MRVCPHCGSRVGWMTRADVLRATGWTPAYLRKLADHGLVRLGDGRGPRGGGHHSYAVADVADVAQVDVAELVVRAWGDGKGTR